MTLDVFQKFLFFHMQVTGVHSRSHITVHANTLVKCVRQILNANLIVIISVFVMAWFCFITILFHFNSVR